MKKYRLAMLFVGVFSLLASACTSEAASMSAKKNTPTEDIEKVQVNIKPSSTAFFGPEGPKASDLNPNNVVATFTNPADATRYSLLVENAVPVVDGDSKGEISFNVKITNKTNPKLTTTKTFDVTGLRKAFGGYIDLNIMGRFGPADSDLLHYNTLTRYEQFQQDNERYVTNLKRAIAGNLQNSRDGIFDPTKFRTDVQTSEADKKIFDEKAKSLHLSTYDDSLVKGFGVPVYQKSTNGGADTVKAINLYNGEMNKFPSWRDIFGRDQYKANGLPRILPNDVYKNIALQTYAFSVDNRDPEKPNTESYKRTRGTVWILDYEPTNDHSYPTRWYFGTNLHVADALTNQTAGVSFSIVKKSVSVRSQLPPIDGVDQTYFDTYYLPNLHVVNEGVAEPQYRTTARSSDDHVAAKDGQQLGIRTVFTADDYLNSDPKDFLVQPANASDKDNTDYQNYHEFLDFAVIEVDFQALWDSSIHSAHDNYANSHGYKSAAEYAKAFTRDYAEQTSTQIKFVKQSYLKNYSKVDYPLFNKEDAKKEVDLTKYDTFFLLGYPLSQADWGFKQYEDQKWIDHRGQTVSLWVNGEGGWYDNPAASITGQKADKVGDQLSTNIGYQTFGDKPGIVDSFISASRAGKNFYFNPNHRGGKRLIDFGLEYVPRHYAPYGGSSGSSMRNQNNELVAVFHVGNNTAKAGLAAAFRSEGFNYQGLYGKYNLPEYDLIYGGGKDQKKSFRQSLEALYGRDYITNLFKTNVSETPAEFRFPDTKPDTSLIDN